MNDAAAQPTVSDLRLTVSTTRPLRADGVYDEPVTDGLERWSVRAHTPGSPDPIATLAVLAVDLLACADPWAALDSSNDDIAHIGDVVFDVNTGQLAEGLASSLRDTGDRVLVLDRVVLAPDWQGRGLAALLLAETLQLLRTGVRVALCLPGPLDRGEEGDYPQGYDEAVRRMTQVWSRLGFRPHTEGVWLLEPARDRLSDTLARLREEHGLGVTSR